MSYSKAHKSRSKARILRSATELFGRYAFDKVSIGQIMKLARMTHGAFYAHFESKEALYSESLLETMKRGRLARLVKGPFTLKQLTALVSDYLSLRELKDRSGAGPESILFNEVGNERMEIRRLYEQAYQQMRKMVETRITALARLGKLPIPLDKDVIEEKARAILASLVGAVVVARSLPQVEEQKRILSATQRQILLMLGVPESELSG